jgi:hemerythrin-like metal-binding protein
MELPVFAWNDDYAIGHTELDAEHHRLVETINEICSIKHAECTPDQLKPLLETLTIIAVEHFKNENALIREVICWASDIQESHRAVPGIMIAAAMNEHCADHARALLELETIIHAIYFAVWSDRAKLSKMLMGWFAEHALKQDADLREALRVYFAKFKSSGASNSR